MLAIQKFKILSNKLRIKIIKILVSRDYYVKELAHLTGKQSSKVCDELVVLKRNGVVTPYYKGVKTYYRLKDKSLIEIINFAESK